MPPLRYSSAANRIYSVYFVSNAAHRFNNAGSLRIGFQLFAQPFNINGQGVVIYKVARNIPNVFKQLCAR